MDQRYLEVSEKYHLPQIPAEGRSDWTVVWLSEQGLERGQESLFLEGTLASDTMGAPAHRAHGTR